MSWSVESGTLVKLVAFRPARARKFTVFLLSEYTQEELFRVPKRTGETGGESTSAQRRQQHPFFRVRIKSSKGNVWRDRPADCRGRVPQSRIPNLGLRLSDRRLDMPLDPKFARTS